MNRRGFLRAVGVGAAPLVVPGLLRGRIVPWEPWGRLEELAPGLWAVISTPLDGPRGGPAWQTLCNGGIIAGRDEVLLVEAFATGEGATWIADAARAATGRRPGVAVVTHFHGDHCGGVGALAGTGTRVRSTRATRDLLGQRDALPEALIPDEPVTLDLGGRIVRIVPRDGHTPSDVTLELDDPPVIWCGDLVWNRMFPNFVDAIPSHQVRHCERLLGRAGTLYVPGHGDVGDAAALAPYLALLQDLEEAARRAFATGTPADAAADAYRIPAALGDWTMFSPDYPQRAFRAWEEELSSP